MQTETCPKIWGLDANGVHDAWWKSRGVQCVGRGGVFQPDPGAELFLLMEPDQLVAFDLSEIAEAMVWNEARATGIRVIERSEEGYKERVVRSGSGEILGIRRSYVHDEKIGYRLIMTPHANIASRWAASSNRRAGWLGVRDECRGRFDHQKVYGHCYDFKLIENQRDFFSWVIATWDDPGRVIEGVNEVAPGIFAVVENLDDSKGACIAPAWIGFRSLGINSTPLVGPDFLEDSGEMADQAKQIRVLPINEIMLPRGRAKERLLPRRSLYGIGKRIFDISWALAVLIFMSPIFLLVAILVSIDDGFPLLFGHVRQKRGGRTFRCWKFRTMRRDAESMVKELQAMNKADGPQVFIESDPRVTRVGKYLRKLQLDELPQFWNVLVGDMSIVGPRPSPDKENQFCPAWREMRLSVRPGITGLWQVKRTRATGEDFQEWIKYDIEYTRTASFWLDLTICVRTAWNIISRK